MWITWDHSKRKPQWSNKFPIGKIKSKCLSCRFTLIYVTVEKINYCIFCFMSALICNNTHRARMRPFFLLLFGMSQALATWITVHFRTRASMCVFSAVLYVHVPAPCMHTFLCVFFKLNVYVQIISQIQWYVDIPEKDLSKCIWLVHDSC